jgi:hypothetical protein
MESKVYQISNPTYNTGNKISNNFETGTNPSPGSTTPGSNPENKEIQNLLSAGLTLSDLAKENIKATLEGGYTYSHICLDGTYPKHEIYIKNSKYPVINKIFANPVVKRNPDSVIQQAKAEGKKIRKYDNPKSNYKEAKDGSKLHKNLSECGKRYINDALSNSAARSIFKNKENHSSQFSKDILVICESFNDAAALSKQGIGAFSVSGIGNFPKISNEIKEYINRVNPNKIILLYDSDSTQIKKNDNSDVINLDRGFRESIDISLKRYYVYLDKNNIDCKVEARILNTSKKDVIDNLKEVIANGLQPDHFLKKVLSKDPDLKYCDIIKATKTTIDDQLDKIFGSNYKEAYKKHYKEIRDKKFRFKGAIYKPELISNHNEDLFTQLQKGIKSEPEYFFKVDTKHLENEELNTKKENYLINKFISEKLGEIKAKIEANDILFWKTPTGSGKTSTITGFKDPVTGKQNKGLIQSPEFKNKRIVIAVPKVQLAQQISNDTGIPAIFEGSNPFRRKNNIKAVICTYDSLHKVPFNPDIVILDEAHNLIKAVNYRSEALNLALDYCMNAKKVIFLSATMPDLLYNIAKELKPDANICWMEFKRLQSNKISYHFVEASAKEDGKIAQAIRLIKKINKEKQGAGVISIYWNDTKAGEKLKQALKFEGISKEGIVLINKKHLNDSEATKQALNEIKHKSEIQTPEILIHTCLIDEGININNQNIKAAILIDNKDPDAAIQATNRYRKQINLDVYDIRQKERDVKGNFLLNAVEEFNRKVLIGKLNLSNFNKHYKQFREDQEADDLHFVDDYFLLDSSVYGLNYPYLKKTNSGANINYLEIAHEENKRIQDSANNAYYLTEVLKSGNFHFKGYCNLDDVEEIKPLTDCIDESEKEVIENLKNDLNFKFNDVIAALFWHYKQNRNTSYKNTIKFYLPDLAKELEGMELEPEYYKNNKILFKTAKYYNRFIRDWIFLNWMQYSTDRILQIFEENQNNISALKSNWIIWNAAKVYSDRNTRKLLNNIGARARAQTFIKIIKFLQGAKTDPNLQKEILLSQLINDLKIYLGYYDTFNKGLKTDQSKVDYLAKDNFIFTDSELKFFIYQFADGTINKYLSGTTITLSGEIKQGAFMDSVIGSKHRNFLAFTYKFNDLEHFKNIE